MKKKIISMLLVCLMIVSLFPMGALAVTTDDCTGECTHVAAIGTTHYDTLQAAVDAAKAAENAVEIDLLADVTEGTIMAYGFSGSLVIDLNGKTWTANDGVALAGTAINFTLIDSVGDGLITNQGTTGTSVEEAPTALIDAGLNSTITLQGGKLINVRDDLGAVGALLGNNVAFEGTNVETQGKLIGDDLGVGILPNITITAGTFNVDPTNYVDANNYTVTENLTGTWTVTKKGEEPAPVTNVAKIGDTEYESLAAAIEAVPANETIKLANDITITKSLSSDKSFKIDLNGHNLTLDNGVILTIAAGGNVTVVDNGTPKGLVTVNGTIKVNGTFNFKTLGFGETGLAAGGQGGLIIGSTGCVKMSDAVGKYYSNVPFYSASNPSQSVAGGNPNFLRAEVGACVEYPVDYVSWPWTCTAKRANPDDHGDAWACWDIRGDGILQNYKGAGGHVVIPANVKELDIDWNYLGGSEADPVITEISFAENSQLTKISNFAHLATLQSITLPDGLTTIGNQPFAGCSSLNNVVIPSSVTSLGYSVFLGCSKLKNITFEGVPTTIHNNAFNDITGATLTLPANWPENDRPEGSDESGYAYKGGQFAAVKYVVPPVAQIGTTKYDTLAAAIEAAQDGGTVTLLANVELGEQLTIDKAITLYGNGHKITRSTTTGNDKAIKAAILVSAGATLKNLTVSGPNTTNPGWDGGEFGIKLYQANGAKLDNVTVTGANAGIQVNGCSVTMTGTIDLTGNEFGGIELCHGGALDISGATLKNDGETDANPVLWNDDGKGTIEFGTQTFDMVEIAGEGKDHYYLPAQAKIGTVRYATLAAAVAAAQSGETVKLLKAVTTGEKIVVTKSMTIDLDGKKLTRTDPQGNVNADNGTAFEVNATGAVVTVMNGTIDGSGITAKTNHQDDPYGHEVDALVARAGKLVLESLTVNVKTQKGACAYAFAAGNIEIKNGTYTNSYETHNKSDGMVLNQANVTTQLITVTGGTFVGQNPATGDDSDKVTSFLASDCISIEADGGYKVISADKAVAEIGGAKYETLQAAVNAATSGAEIKLLANVQLTSRLVVDKTMTLDLNGKTITGAANDSGTREWFVILAQNDSTPFTLTINDSSEGKTGAVKTGSVDENKSNIPVSAGKNATIIINGGNYVSQMADECVYSLNGGLVNIYGGDFSYQGSWTGHSSGDLLNVQNGTAVDNIKVYGGIFHNGKSLTGGDDAMGPTFVAPGYVAVAGDDGTFTVKEAQVAPVTEVEVKTDSEETKIVIKGTETAITVDGLTVDDASAAADVASAINDVLKNDAVTNFVETGIEAAKPSDLLTTIKDANTGVEIPNGAAITTKISIVPVAAAVEKADEDTVKVTELTFDVKPMAYATTTTGEVSAEFTPAQEIIFRLPVPDAWAGQTVEVKHTHDSETTTTYALVQGTTDFYVELKSSTFSEWNLILSAEPAIAKIGDTLYTASTFQTALDASTAENPIVLLKSLVAGDLLTEDSDNEFVFPTLKQDAYIDRNGFDFPAIGFKSKDNGDFKIIFVNEDSGEAVTAELVNCPETYPPYRLNEFIEVEVKLTAPTGATYNGARIFVEINTTYIDLNAQGTVIPTDDWALVEGSTNVYRYLKYDDENVNANIPVGVSLGNFKLKPKASTPEDGDWIVKVKAAQLTKDASEVFSGGVIELSGEALGTATAVIKGMLTWTANPTATGKTYDGIAWGSGTDDYTATVQQATEQGVTVQYGVTIYTDAQYAVLAEETKNVGTYYVKFTATDTSGKYDAAETKYASFVIAPKELAVGITGVTGLVYNGEEKELLQEYENDRYYTLTGFVNDEGFNNAKVTGVTFNNGTDSKHTAVGNGNENTVYTVTCAVTLADDSNYAIKKDAQNSTVVSTTVTIASAGVVTVITDYNSAYDMVYMFVPKVTGQTRTARAIYTNQNLNVYDITDLGYTFTGEGTEQAPYKLGTRSNSATVGYKVFACLIEGSAVAANVSAVKFNQKIGGAILRAPQDEDVNFSKSVNLSDAVAVAMTYNGDETVMGNASFMATILRADVDGNGAVQIASQNANGDAALIKAEITKVN